MLRLLGRRDKTSESSAETRRSWTNLVGGVFRRTKVDDEFWEDLEEALIVADVGVETAMQLVEKIQEEARWRGARTPDAVYELLRTEISEMLTDGETAAAFAEDGPVAVMVVGVNGSGKTTSIGKLAQAAKSDGRVPLIAAADTFRAGAISQLETWARRTDTMFVSSAAGADPGSVVYDALNAAKSRGADFVVIDTAGQVAHRAQLDGRTQENATDSRSAFKRFQTASVAGHRRQYWTEWCHAGQSVHRSGRLRRSDSDETGQHGKGRRDIGDPRRDGAAGQVHRHGRGY